MVEKKCLIWCYEHDVDVYVTVGWCFAFRICLEDGFCMVQLIFLKSVLTEALVLFIFLYKFKILFGTTLNSHMMARNNNNLTCIYQAVLPYIRRVIYPKYLDRQACADSVDLVRCHGLWHLLKVYTFCHSFGCILQQVVKWMFSKFRTGMVIPYVRKLKSIDNFLSSPWKHM